jgi:hypothetical protein
MDTVETYRKIVLDTLRQYITIKYAYGDIHNEALFDLQADRYIIMSVGWQGITRVHGCLIHIDIIQDKVWIQRDGTEGGVANELVSNGIPKDHIVLGYKEPEIRKFTDFAVA